MSPEETYEEALAIYMHLLLTGQRPVPPPEGATRARLVEAEHCSSEFYREMWLRFVCDPPDGRPMWTLFFKVPVLETDNALSRMFDRLHSGLFNPGDRAV